MKKELFNLIEQALDRFYEKDYQLIENNICERSLVFRIGVYLNNLILNNDELKGYNLDSEYNRLLDNRKETPNFEKGIYPDLLIHKRNINDNNFAYIEFKTEKNNNIERDLKKIRDLIDINGQYKYKYGLSIVLYNDRHVDIVLCEYGTDKINKSFYDLGLKKETKNEKQYDNYLIRSLVLYLNIMNNINEGILDLFNYKENNMDIITNKVYHIILDLIRVFPYSLNNDYSINLIKKDSILSFRNNLDFLLDDYQEILNNNRSLLKKIKILRNKYEHEPHTYICMSFFGCKKEKSINLVKEPEFWNCLLNNIEIENYIKKINTETLTKLIIELNQVFIKIQKFIKIKFKDNNEIIKNLGVQNSLKIRFDEYNDFYMKNKHTI